MRILVVEDEAAVAELLLAVLEDDGHRVALAANGRDGLARLTEERFDLVITDTTMPVMTGPEMVRATRADARIPATPVVVMSALPEKQVGPDYPDYAAFLSKPFRLLEVVSLVDRLSPRP